MTITAYQRQQITSMWWNGETSPTIAKELGLTRNTIMGIVTRGKLKRSPEAPPATNRGGNMRHDRPQPSLPHINGNVAPLAAYELPQRKAERNCLTCKWPLGTNLLEDGFFCGFPVTRGSYCQHHATIAYNNPLNYRRYRED